MFIVVYWCVERSKMMWSDDVSNYTCSEEGARRQLFGLCQIENCQLFGMRFIRRKLKKIRAKMSLFFFSRSNSSPQ